MPCVDPNTSAEAKEHAREVLEGQGLDTGEDLHQTRVNAGYKATLKSMYPTNVWYAGFADCRPTDPNVSEEAKQHAHDLLEERDAL